MLWNFQENKLVPYVIAAINCYKVVPLPASVYFSLKVNNTKNTACDFIKTPESRKIFFSM